MSIIMSGNISISKKVVTIHAKSFQNLPEIKVWLDASDASTVSLRSGFVSQIDNKIAGGINAFQSSESLQPFYDLASVNGLNSIDYLANSHVLTSNWLPTLGNWTIFLVLTSTIGGNQEIITQDRGGTSNNLDTGFGIGTLNGFPSIPFGTFSISTQGPSGQLLSTNTTSNIYADGNPHIFILRVRGTERKLITEIEEKTEIETVSGYFGSNGSTSVAFGGRAPTNPRFTGKLCEFVACQTDLSDSYVESTKEALIDKWGI